MVSRRTRPYEPPSWLTEAASTVSARADTGRNGDDPATPRPEPLGPRGGVFAPPDDEGAP